MKYSTLVKSREDQFARTPKWLLDQLRALFGPMFDPCPTNPQWDGLTIPWKQLNYVNPPYECIGAWLDKAIHEYKRNNCSSVFLIPFRMHTRYIQRALPYISRMHVIDERIRFEGYDKPIGIAIYVCVIGKRFDIPKSISKPWFKMWLVEPNERTIAGFAKECKRYCTNVIILKDGLSQPLNTILNAEKVRPCCIIVPSRLDNAVLKMAVSKASFVLFCCPKVDSNIEGTCAVFIGTSRAFKTFPTKENTVYLMKQSIKHVG